MAVMRYAGELIIDALDTLLQAELPDALDVVEARWAADPQALPDVVTYYKGYTTMMVTMPSTGFPVIVTMTPDMQPLDQGRPTIGKIQYTAITQAWVIADTEAQVKRVAHRYVEAICDVLQGQKVLAGAVQRTALPRVQITEAAAHLKDGDTGDWDEPDDVDYVRLAEITILLESL